jgi:hypothetical protein
VSTLIESLYLAEKNEKRTVYQAILSASDGHLTGPVQGRIFEAR